MLNSNLSIIAGPCSLDESNMDQVFKLALDKNIAGVRVVGLKSRTSFDKNGKGMGIDFSDCIEMLKDGEERLLPSTKFAKNIIESTGKVIATELVIPWLQLSNFEKAGIMDEKLLVWNPAVNQLGWSVLEMTLKAQKYNWYIGLKNPKWLGCRLEDCSGKECSMEKQWWGNYKYALERENTIFIQRGVDIAEKGDFRNALVHDVAKKIKEKGTKIKMYFDPSHTFGQKLKDQIIDGTVDAMKIQLNDGRFLYDGILIEAGDSQTDKDQHISLDELQILIDKLGSFRDLQNKKNTL